MTRIIGLGHYSRTGKTTLAEFLKLSCRRRKITAEICPFAWKLKDVAYQLYGWAGLKPPEHYETQSGAKDRDTVLPALGMTPVDLWVALGTTAIRQNVYDATWVDYVTKTPRQSDVLIIPDVRFPNEIDAIRSLGGIVVKVECVGIKPRDTVADQALVDFTEWDACISAKKGDTAKLQQYAKELAKWIKEGGKFPKG